MYRLIVESLLGLNREGDRLHITPCMPKEWKTFSLSYRYAETVYRIAVVRTSVPGAPEIETMLDGASSPNQEFRWSTTSENTLSRSGSARLPDRLRPVA